MAVRRSGPRRVWLAAVAAVLAAAALLAVALTRVGGGPAELATWQPASAVGDTARAERDAEAREQHVLREVWGLEPHGTRHIAPEESIIRHGRPRRQTARAQAAAAQPAAPPARAQQAKQAKQVASAAPAPSRRAPAAPQPHAATQQDRIDATLKRLKARAKKLGVSFRGKKLTQLDDLPIPDLEYGSSTPDIPFPSGTGGAENKADTQTLAERWQSTWHRSRADEADPGDAKFEDAGINVNAADPMFPDQSGDRDVDASMIYPTIQFDAPPKQSLYAPAWSPDYLEPARHAPTDHAAWNWIARAKKLEEAFEREEMAKLKEGTASPPDAAAAAQKPAQKPAEPKSQLAGAERSRHGFGSAWELPKGPESASRREREEAIAQAWGMDRPRRAVAADSTGQWAGTPRRGSAKEKAALQELKKVDSDEEQARADERAARKREQQQLHGLYGGAEKAATLTALAEVSPGKASVKDPCPWYGCADGSDSSMAWKKKEKLQAAAQILKQQQEQQRKMDATTDLNAKTEQLLGFPTVESPTQKLLAHGYGTTNSFQADPITAAHDQFYGGDHHYYGSDLPVFARGEGAHAARNTKSHVKAHEAYAADGKRAVYDLDEPHSFDSVPLASPSSFLSRVEANYPSGYDTAHPTSPGKLQAKLFRGQVLADWRKYEHGLTKCMEAEATVEPNLHDYSCRDVSTGLSYLQSCMQNHKFGLESVSGAPQLAQTGGGASEGAWGALPKLVEMTYQLHPKDYQTVHQVLSNSAVFGALWNMERLHARCAATGSAVRYRTRGSRVRQIDSEVKYLDRLLKWWYPGTPEQQKGEAIIQGAYKGLPWEHASQARGAARNYWTYTNSKYPDASAYPNLPSEKQFYGPETGYMAADWLPADKDREGLPRWRVPAGGDESVQNPAGRVGSLGDYTMQQPRSKLQTDDAVAGFPVTVNGKFVDPANPRPWQADKGAYNPWTGYFWTGAWWARAGLGRGWGGLAGATSLIVNVSCRVRVCVLRVRGCVHAHVYAVCARARMLTRSATLGRASARRRRRHPVSIYTHTHTHRAGQVRRDAGGTPHDAVQHWL